MKTYTSGSHKFFDELVTILSSMAFFAQSIESKTISPTYCIGMGGCTLKKDLEFYPYDLMQSLLSDSWPSIIELHEKPHESGIPEKIAKTYSSGGIQKLTSIATQGAFIRYFENQRNAIESRFGTDPYSWPTAWNFARVIRNAFAHGGKIKFDNPNARSVTWQTITYSPTDNERMIMYQDISQVDIIYLMEEMDSSI